MNYYNDNSRDAADWLQNLVAAGLIPYGHVDHRSIRDVSTRDLDGYTQCHFFAGIGGWPLALGLAGWPIDRPVWTGSCPCQPFSSAGLRKGEADERHLWPEFYRLVSQCRPPNIFGEQVASPDGRQWLSRVRIDLEAMDYGVGAADLCASSVGAPHIRQRLYFAAQRLADTDNRACIQGREDQRRRDARGATEPRAGLASRREFGGRGNTDDERLARPAQFSGEPGVAAVERASAWADAEWLDCADGKARRVKPGVPLLVDGLPRSVAPALSGFGNAIIPQLAAEFIRAFDEATQR